MITENIYFYIAVLIIAFIISIILELMVLPRIIYISKKKHLYESSDKNSSMHSNPQLAGISFFPILLVVFSFCCIITSKYAPASPFITIEADFIKLFGLIIGNILILGSGIKSDLVGSRNLHKKIIQIIAAMSLVYSGLYLNNLNGLFGIWEIPASIGMPPTVILIVFIINATNMIDGANGLASGISIIALITLGILFLIRGMFLYTLVSIIMVGILLPFFYYNAFKPKRKISIGETGSFTLGFILSYLGIRFAMEAPTNYEHFNAPILIFFSTLLVPIFDSLRVILSSIFSDTSLRRPFRLHIHHKLLALGFSQHKVLICLVTCAELLILLNIFLVKVININIMFVLNLAIWIGFVKIVNIRLKKQKELNNHCVIISFNKVSN